MITLFHNDFEIELVNDDTYSPGSVDNKNHYNFEYYADEDDNFYPSSFHGIFLKKDNEIIKSAILIGKGGATGTHDNSAVIIDDNILICVSDSVFSLTINDLKLNWTKEVDMATCFQLFNSDKGIIVHGELSISKITLEGEIEWSFGGADIFVTPESGNEIELCENYIDLLDWNGTKYRIDYNGNEIK